MRRPEHNLNRAFLAAPLAIFVFAACSSDAPPVDDEAADASQLDSSATAPDSGRAMGAPDADPVPDAALPADGGSPDAGSEIPDAASSPEAGPDASRSDSGRGDAGVPDSSRVDTGVPDSGRRPDAALRPDAMVVRDSGAADSGAPTDDGMPVRMQCTSMFGNGLSATFGRMDGILVSIIPVGGPRTCHGDSTHLHLQVLIQRSVYDVAVNLDTQQLQADLTLPSPWADGWHPGVRLDYVQLGFHSTDFSDPADPQASINTFLQTANHVSIYATGYNMMGAHDVHRHGTANDGAIIINPLSTHARGLFFNFARTSF